MSDSQRQAQVVFTPSGKRGSFDVGTSILSAARQLGVDLDSVCGGRGLCGRCQVLCPEGHFAKHQMTTDTDHVSAVTTLETRYQRIHGAFAEGRRLGCQSRIEGDLVVDIPADSQIHQQVIRKALDARPMALNPAVRLHVVEVEQPDMHQPSGDLRRLREALEREWGLADLNAPLAVIQQLQTTLRSGQWQITAAVHREQEIIAVWPGFQQHIYGLAIDVGSTTIAGHLADLGSGHVIASSGAMNPQIRFGEDLMSRVSYVMMNAGGETHLHQAVIEAVNHLITEVCASAGIEREAIIDLTLVANPVMHHLLLGINPVELGGAPFALAADEALTVSTRELGIQAHPQAKAYLLPCIAGHVGADTAGVVLSEKPQHSEALTLLVDVGTNAEIVLAQGSSILACSSPTGPAFEGAQISGGQRAAPGAIERVRIDPDTLEPRFRIIGSETWSDEPGFAADTAHIGVTGICGSGIIEIIGEMFLTGIIDSDGVINGALSARSPRIQADGRTFAYHLYGRAESDHDTDALNTTNDSDNNHPHTTGISLRITQNDVRQIQLAKAALYAGVRLLMDRLNVEKVERIRLAGAFGSHIDVKYAMILGLIPDCDLQQVSSAGNAAGTGALMALLDCDARTDIERSVRRIEKVETAVEPDFQKHFVDAMAFPHKSADFTELSKVVTLPVSKPAAPARRSRRRTRAANQDAAVRRSGGP